MEKDRVTGFGRKLTHQKSRLQMHAPSSIQVAPAPAGVAEWNVAIPLLSPLDIVSLPSHWDPTADDDQGDKGEPAGGRMKEDEDRRAPKWSAWQHPAEPFYYEPVGGNGPAILLPHRA